MNIKEIPYNLNLEQVTEQLKKGVFLTVRGENTINTMTAGWCLIGYTWNRPIFQVLVDTSRYTYELLEKSGEFSVSVPLSQNLSEALNFCGTKSGRDINKIAACGLSLFDGIEINTPAIADCELHYECKLVAKQRLPVEEIDGTTYNNTESNISPNYHVMFYGEIVKCYLINP